MVEPLDRFQIARAARAELARRQSDADVKAECEGSLYVFLKHAWRHFESGPFQGNWHIEAVAEHLEAVSLGEINKLVVNIPPRSCKTNLVTVAWPCWTWARPQDPRFPRMGAQVRFLCAAYGARKAQQDGVTSRRLIGTTWYRRFWGDRVRICFPATQVIQTEVGPRRIDQVVDRRERLLVPSWNEKHARIEMRPIVGWHRNPGADIYEMTLRGGVRVRATAGHRFRMADGTWLPMACVPVGSAVQIVRPPKSFGGVPPRSPFADSGDVRWRNSIAKSQIQDELSADANGLGLSVAQFGGWRGLASGDGSMGPHVGNVVRSGAISEIFQAAMPANAIAVADLLTVGVGAKEGDRHEFVDSAFDGPAFDPQIQVGIPVAVERRSQDASRPKPLHWRSELVQVSIVPRQRFDPPEGRRGVPDEVWNIAPDLDFVASVARVGHEDVTYCVTVADHHNLMVGDNTSIVAANCSDRDNAEQFDTLVGGSRINTGIPESLGKGGLIRLLDDPNKSDEVDGSPVLESVTRAYDEVWSTRSNDPAAGAEVIIMQRLSENDMTGHVLERAGWTHLMIPAQYEPERHCVTVLGSGDERYEWHDPRGLDADGNLLPIEERRERAGEPFWPDRFRAEIYPDGERVPPDDQANEWCRQKQAEIGSHAWAGQMQQRPVARGGNLIQSEWWRLWDKDFPKLGTIIVSYDSATGMKKMNSFRACTVWGAFAGPRGRPCLLLLDAWRMRSTFFEAIQRLVGTCQDERERRAPVAAEVDEDDERPALEWHPHLIGDKLVQGHGRKKPKITAPPRWEADYLLVEDKSDGRPVAQEIVRLMGSRRWNTILVDPGTADKYARLQQTQYLFEQGVIWAPDTNWAQMVIDEVSSFPTGKFNDLVDTVSMAINWVRKNGVVLTKEEHDAEEEEALLFRREPEPLYDV
jgi:hypothetical protein